MKLFKIFRKKAEQPIVVKAEDVDFTLAHMKSVELSNGIKLTPHQRGLLLDAVIEALNEKR